nr:hypothetical protein [Rhizobium sp. L1K21]
MDGLESQTGSIERGHLPNTEVLSHFCASEAWTGNLRNGLIRLGELTTDMHGLKESECGLLTLIRCYDPEDRHQLLNILEQATTRNSSFCYSTMIHLGNEIRRPVFCIGESTGLQNSDMGKIHGVFIFPGFKLQGRGQDMKAALQ